MRILVLEDDPERLKWFRYATIGCVVDTTKDVEEAKRWIDEREYDQIFLDHDLAEEHYAVWREGSDKHDATTGYAVARHLAENPSRSSEAVIVVHSMNPIGGKRMADKIAEARKNVQWLSYPLLKQANGVAA